MGERKLIICHGNYRVNIWQCCMTGRWGLMLGVSPWWTVNSRMSSPWPSGSSFHSVNQHVVREVNTWYQTFILGIEMVLLHLTFSILQYLWLVFHLLLWKKTPKLRTDKMNLLEEGMWLSDEVWIRALVLHSYSTYMPSTANPSPKSKRWFVSLFQKYVCMWCGIRTLYV